MAADEDSVTLYFINGRNAKAADNTRAGKIPGIVRFRDVNKDDGQVEECDYVTAEGGVTIPTQYVAVPRTSPEKPVSLIIVPDALSLDLSDVEHGDLRAMALFEDGTMADVTTLCAWTSGTTGTATIGAATGFVTPVGVGTTLITATYNWAAPGETGVAYAARVYTLAGLPAAADTFTIDGHVYTYRATITDASAANDVLIGATVAATLKNAKAAVNAEAWGKGVVYGADTVAHPTVRISAVDATTMTATAINPGTGGNALASTEAGANSSWAGATLTGGTNSTGVADTTTVTVVA